jgi:hypothetical protein
MRQTPTPIPTTELSLYTAQIRVVLWGKEWASSTAPVSVGDAMNDLQSIVSGPYLDGLDEYEVSGARVDCVIDLTTEDPPNPIGLDDAGNRIKGLIDDGVVPEPDDDVPSSIYVVFLAFQAKGRERGLPPNAVGYHSRLIDVERGLAPDWRHLPRLVGQQWHPRLYFNQHLP